MDFARRTGQLEKWKAVAQPGGISANREACGPGGRWRVQGAKAEDEGANTSDPNYEQKVLSPILQSVEVCAMATLVGPWDSGQAGWVETEKGWRGGGGGVGAPF